MSDTTDDAVSPVGRVRWGTSMTDAGDFVLPAGTVTLLLGDVEQSTRLWEQRSGDMPAWVADMYADVDDAVGRHGGVRPVEQGEGDSFVAAFSRGSDAVACALDLQLRWCDAPMRVRMGVHTGEVQLRDTGNYIGSAIIRAARLRDVGHGGQILLSRVTAGLVCDALPTDTTLVALGTHRLKDLGLPEEISQLVHPKLVSEFPALRSLDAVPNNLPAQLTSFVGRETELSELLDLVRNNRMVTLTGSGGCGKTRLALQAAAEVVGEFPDGAWLVDLSSVVDPALVGPAIASTFRVGSLAGRSVTDALVDELRGQRTLLVIDNCEQVVSACAEVLASILQGCPSMAVIATSRELLGVPGELAWRVPSMGLPGLSHPTAIEALAVSDAVQLFIERARRARPNFTVNNDNAPSIAAICNRLDGIPLAIELAAARVRVLSVEQIAGGLSDRFRLLGSGPRTALPRQSTLAASVAWSYDLLEPDERVLLRRLSVFAGGFDLDAAEAVCAIEPLTALRVLELMSSLVDRSMVLADDHGRTTRYRLLETIRAYALDQLLDADDADDLRTRHLDHYVDLARRAAVRAMGPDQPDAFKELDLEEANLDAALRWSQVRDEPEALISLCASLGLYWLARTRHTEATAWVDEALAATTDSMSAERGMTLVWRAWLAMEVFDVFTHLSSAEQAIAIGHDLDHSWVLAAGSDVLAWGLTWTDPPRARGLWEQVVEIARREGFEFLLADALQGLGHHRVFVEGKLADARQLLEEAIAISDRIGDEFNVVRAVSWLAVVADAECKFDEAVALYLRGATGTHLPMKVFSLGGLARLSVWRGDIAEAERLAREALALAETSFIAQGQSSTARVALVDIATSAGRMDEARAHASDVIGQWFGPGRRLMGGAWLAGLNTIAGDLDAAEAHAVEGLEALEDEGGATFFPWTRRYLAESLRAAARHREAEDLAHQALGRALESGSAIELVCTLETLGRIALDQEAPREAGRLFAAAETFRDTTGFVWSFHPRDNDHARLRDALGAEFDDVWAEGAALSLTDAATYARRGRGKRKRPSSGWESLTPTEQQVVTLVVQGLSNPEVAERLFISRRTVASHLTHIFGKLNVQTRAELMALALRRTR